MMDAHNMREHRGISLWAGIGLLTVMAVVVALVISDFRGAFSDDVHVTARLPDDAAVVAENSAVHYHGVEVGSVTGTPHPDGDGNIVVGLALDPQRIGQIPARVRAAIGPLSVFGNQYVTLIDPADASTGTGPGTERSGHTISAGLRPGEAPQHSLRAGTVIPPVTARDNPSLQSTVATLDELLRQIHPGRLNAGLSGLASALAGRGESLGDTLVKADKYLTQMLPLWPKFVEDAKKFAPLAHSLADITPRFLDLLDNAAVSADTLSRHAADFTDLLGNGAQASQQVAALLRATADSYADAVGGAKVLLTALSQKPTVIGELLDGLSTAAKTWRSAMHGNTVDVQATLKVVNPSALALAMVSSNNLQRLLNKAMDEPIVNPPTYTAGDCPRYGKARGNCGGGR